MRISSSKIILLFSCSIFFVNCVSKKSSEDYQLIEKLDLEGFDKFFSGVFTDPFTHEEYVGYYSEIPALWLKENHFNLYSRKYRYVVTVGYPLANLNNSNVNLAIQENLEYDILFYIYKIHPQAEFEKTPPFSFVQAQHAAEL